MTRKRFLTPGAGMHLLAILLAFGVVAAACGNDDTSVSGDGTGRGDDQSSDNTGAEISGPFCTNAEMVMNSAFAAILGLAFDPSRDLVDFVVGPLADAAAEVEASIPDEMDDDLAELLGLITGTLIDIPDVLDGVDLDDPDAVADALDSLDSDQTFDDDPVMGDRLDDFLESHCGFRPLSGFDDGGGIGSEQVSYLDCDAIDRSAVEATTGAGLVDVTTIYAPEGGSQVHLGDTELLVPLSACSFALDTKEFGPDPLRITVYVPDPGDDLFGVARAAAADHDEAVTIEGIGDDAFLTRPVSFTTSLYVLVGDRVLLVNYSAGVGAEAPPAEQVVALAEAALVAMVG